MEAESMDREIHDVDEEEEEGTDEDVDADDTVGTTC
jgi:hypothetical protein